MSLDQHHNDCICIAISMVLVLQILINPSIQTEVLKSAY